MQFHLRCHDEDIRIDFDTYESTGWYNSEYSKVPTHYHASLHSWEAVSMNTCERIHHLLIEYPIISIDNVPFAEWRILHPEYFI